MTIKKEIQLHPESIDYIERVLSQYTEIDELKIINNPIIHIYAKEDTRDESGELNGYMDALFADYHVYDTKNTTVYKSKGYHDSVMFYDGAAPNVVKIFKDGSTLMEFHGQYSISFTTTVCIRKVGE